MEEVPALLIATGVAAGAAARWTRWSPLRLVLLSGIPGGVLGLLVAASATSHNGWAFALVSYAVTATAGALGAFIGRVFRRRASWPE
jgi:hypothetical protein